MEKRIEGLKVTRVKKKDVLEKKVSEIKEKEAREDYERKLRDRVPCSACLEQQRIQRKIDKYEHAQRLVESLERTLVCEYCRHPNFAYDGDLVICVQCGCMQSDETKIHRGDLHKARSFAKMIDLSE